MALVDNKECPAELRATGYVLLAIHHLERGTKDDRRLGAKILLEKARALADFTPWGHQLWFEVCEDVLEGLLSWKQFAHLLLEPEEEIDYALEVDLRTLEVPALKAVHQALLDWPLDYPEFLIQGTQWRAYDSCHWLEALKKQGLHLEIIQAVEAILLFQQRPNLWFHLGFSALACGDPAYLAKAQNAFERVLLEQPENVGAVKNLAIALERLLATDHPLTVVHIQ